MRTPRTHARRRPEPSSEVMLSRFPVDMADRPFDGDSAREYLKRRDPRTLNWFKRDRGVVTDAATAAALQPICNTIWRCISGLAGDETAITAATAHLDAASGLVFVRDVRACAYLSLSYAICTGLERLAPRVITALGSKWPVQFPGAANAPSVS